MTPWILINLVDAGTCVMIPGLRRGETTMRENQRVVSDGPAASSPILASLPRPLTPQLGVLSPEGVDLLGRRPATQPATLWWVGVHGGAGESTLAALVDGSHAADHRWPVPEDPSQDTARVLLVARSSAHGLHRAQLACTQWASGSVPGVELLGLVLVADAPGRLPRPLRDLAALVAGGAPRVWHLPWIESWRLGAPPLAETSPLPVRRLLLDLDALLSPGAAGPSTDERSLR
jgi:hypothetical protein